MFIFYCFCFFLSEEPDFWISDAIACNKNGSTFEMKIEWRPSMYLECDMKWMAIGKSISIFDLRFTIYFHLCASNLARRVREEFYWDHRWSDSIPQARRELSDGRVRDNSANWDSPQAAPGGHRGPGGHSIPARAQRDSPHWACEGDQLQFRLCSGITWDFPRSSISFPFSSDFQQGSVPMFSISFWFRFHSAFVFIRGFVFIRVSFLFGFRFYSGFVFIRVSFSFGFRFHSGVGKLGDARWTFLALCRRTRA